MGILSFEFKSETIKETARVSVILPEQESSRWGYDDSTEYPSLYLLHHNGGDNSDFIRYSQVELFAIEKQVAVILPDMGYTFCSNQKHGNGKDNFDYIVNELPSLLENILPLSGDRTKRFVAGIGSGGYGAFKWAFRNPDSISFSAAISGGFGANLHELQRNPDYDPAENSYFNQTFGSMDEYLHSIDDLDQLLDDADAARLPPLFSICGEKDEYSRSFAEAASQKAVKIMLKELTQGANWYSWNDALKSVFDSLPL